MYLHKILKGKTDNNTIHSIGLKIISYINRLDETNRIFFCGKSESLLLSGIMYILINNVGIRITQYQLTKFFPSARKNTTISNHLTECSIRNSYKYWLKQCENIPELQDEKIRMEAWKW